MRIYFIFNFIERYFSIFKNYKIVAIFSAVLWLHPMFSWGQLVFTGAGVVFQPSNNYPVVSKVMLFSPAADSGIKNGETIWLVDGKSTQGLAMNEVSALIKGSEGTERTLVVGADKREVKLKIRKVSGKCTKGDCLNGEGRIEEPSGNVYVGEFENGKFTWGNLVYANGDRYEGFFANGVAEGEGRYYNYRQGFRYKGDFKADKFHGTGNIEFFKGRSVYVGSFQANEPVGEGTLTTEKGVSKTIKPQNWNQLIEEATGEKAIAQKKESPVSKPAPKRDLIIDDDKNNTKGSDFTSLLDQMKRAESKIYNSLAAYPAFRAAYKAGLDKSNAAGAAQNSKKEFEKFLLPFGESLELMKALGSKISANSYLNERQNNALQGWATKIGEILDLVKAGKRNGQYSPEGCYWINLNVEKANKLLDEASAQRRAF